MAETTKTFTFGITDTYGRECGARYEIQPIPVIAADGDKKTLSRVWFEALRCDHRYQSRKYGGDYSQPGDAQAHAEKMVENYRKRCAKQFAKPSNAAAA
jgi:hypothetical protein